MTRTRGLNACAETYVIIKDEKNPDDEILIYSETPVKSIQEQIQSEKNEVWIDISSWVTEKVIPIEKTAITSFGQMEELRKWKKSS